MRGRLGKRPPWPIRRPPLHLRPTGDRIAMSVWRLASDGEALPACPPREPGLGGIGLMEKSSVYLGGGEEALRYKWIESEKAGHDLGQAALPPRVQNHAWGCLP